MAAIEPETQSGAAPDAPALEWQEALNRVRGRNQLLAKMMSLFLEQASGLLDDAAEAIKRRDGEALRLSAHTLKGSANSIGAFEFGKIAQRIESSGLEAAYADADADLALLRAAMLRLEPEIQTFLAEYSV